MSLIKNILPHFLKTYLRDLSFVMDETVEEKQMVLIDNNWDGRGSSYRNVYVHTERMISYPAYISSTAGGAPLANRQHGSPSWVF